MHKISLCFILIFLLSNLIRSQVETIPADHPIYPFLKSLFVKGILESYDDIVLPLSKQKIIDLLKQLEIKKEELTPSEREFLCRMEIKLGIKEDFSSSYFSGFPGGFIDDYLKYTEKHLYTYRDSTAKLNIDILGDITPIYSYNYKDYSVLLNLGGQIYGTYSDWMGFLVEGSNGTQLHSRLVSEFDPRVKSSFTFNRTKINFFDYTQGYVRLQKGDVGIQLGRERVLWGNGYINKMILSDNPPLFDFLRFNFSYKSIRYDFLHAWLIQPYNTIYVDSIVEYIKEKGSKYLAISRLGFSPSHNLKLGLSEMIIYANRPIEAAYLTPFLFWESAQRSLGDLDNSFLAIDVSYKIVNGLESSASIIFDDILLSVLFRGEFNKVNNRSAWQAGVLLTNPLLPSDFSLKIEYLQIRPFTFSHPGVGESLTYTNNSYILGTNIQPNSTALSAELSYLLNGNMNLKCSYSHILHGQNYYDENGKLIKNVGGNIFETKGYNYSTLIAPLLDGILEKTDQISFSFESEIYYGIYLNFLVNLTNDKSGGVSQSNNSFFSQLKFYFR